MGVRASVLRPLSDIVGAFTINVQENCALQPLCGRACYDLVPAVCACVSVFNSCSTVSVPRKPPAGDRVMASIWLCLCFILNFFSNFALGSPCAGERVMIFSDCVGVWFIFFF